MAETIRTHEEAEAVLRGVLPGVRDLKFFTYCAPSGRRSLDIPPHPELRGWSCTLPVLGKSAAVLAGSWLLPTTAEEITRDAREQIEKAFRLRGREMVHEQDLDEARMRDDAEHEAA